MSSQRFLAQVVASGQVVIVILAMLALPLTANPNDQPLGLSFDEIILKGVALPNAILFATQTPVPEQVDVATPNRAR